MRRTVVSGFIAAMAVPAIATGGTYDVPACSTAVPTPGAWQPVISHPDALETVASCGSSGRNDGLVAREISGPINTPDGARAEWLFTAAPGTRITGVTGQRWASAQIDDGWHVDVADGTGRTIEQCAPGPGMAICDLGAGGQPGEPGFATFGAANLDTDRLSIGVSCRVPAESLATTCTNGPGSHFATFTARDLLVTISDPTPPVVASADGSLRPGAGRWVHGTGFLQVTGVDTGSGVARVGLLVNGNEVATAAAACQPERPNPCPANHAGTLSLDTGALPDGPAELRTFAEDASGERATDAASTLLVDNTAPSTRPRTPAVATAGKALAIRLPGDAGSPISRAEWRFIPIRGGRQYRSSAGAPALRFVRVTAPPAGRYRLAFTLTDAAGNRGAETTAPISIRPATGGVVPVAGRVVIRNGRLVALLPVTASQRARRARVSVQQAGRPVRRFTRVIGARRRVLTVPLGRPLRTAGRVVVRWRLIGSRTTHVARPRTPARPSSKEHQ